MVLQLIKVFLSGNINIKIKFRTILQMGRNQKYENSIEITNKETFYINKFF